ncbi:hypothetical protein TNCV_108401 [Trichonephila clavipes]|nr:hypothetical protein TNCV_108401 [Trichonephila clavipes]
MVRRWRAEGKGSGGYHETCVISVKSQEIAEDCGFQMLNDGEIVTSLQEESDPVDDEMDEDEDNNEKRK